MKWTFLKGLIGVLLILSLHPASTQGAESFIRCQADFSPMDLGVMTVQIVKEDQGRLQSDINGKVLNRNVESGEHRIRKNLNLRTDPYSPEAASLNAAETSLVHLQSLMDNKDLRTLIKIPFELQQVKQMKIYDLQGHHDKFGGTVLMEAYNQEGKLLGRVLRAVFANGCS